MHKWQTHGIVKSPHPNIYNIRNVSNIRHFHGIISQNSTREILTIFATFLLYTFYNTKSLEILPTATKTQQTLPSFFWKVEISIIKFS